METAGAIPSKPCPNGCGARIPKWWTDRSCLKCYIDGPPVEGVPMPQVIREESRGRR
jgi:hypothetical protein